MASISPREIGLLLDLPDDVVDALIASGRFLCHVRDGETRIPLDQLEAFFRDGLIRVIRAAAMVEPASELRQRDQEEQEEKEEVIAAPAMVIEPAEVKKRNARHAPRFIPRRQIGGIFKDVKFSIVQISASGFRIRHNDPLIPGDDAKLTFALMNPPRSFLVRARVVWTSVAHYENDDANTFCISGLRVTAHEERVKNAIDILQKHHELQPEQAAQSVAPSGVSDDEVALVMKAVQKFACDPSEATRWYSRARFALSDEHVRRTAPPRPRDREQVLGIWEYLDRQVEIPKIAGVLTWMQRATAAPPTPQ
jgi:hypothetical protein